MQLIMNFEPIRGAHQIVRRAVFAVAQGALSVLFMLGMRHIGFVFNTASVVLILALSLVCGAFLNRAIGAFVSLCREFGRARGAICLGLLSVYGAVAVSGNYLALFGTGSSFVLCAAVFIVAMVWCGNFALTFFALLAYAPRLIGSRGATGRRTERQVFWAVFAAVMFSAVVVLIAYNPAITSPDSRSVLWQAKGLLPLTNWHTPFYILLVKLIVSVWDNLTFLALLHAAFFAFSVAQGASLLCALKASRWCGMLYGFIIALSPGNALLSVTLWKDVPYASALLWLTVLIARTLLPGRAKGLCYWAQVTIALVLVVGLRQNGIVPFLVLAAAFPLVVRRREALISVGIACLCAMVFFGPVFDALGIDRDAGGGKYIGLGQDMVFVCERGGDLDEQAQAMVDTLRASSKYKFSPYRATLSYALDVPMGDFIGAYLRTALHNPVLIAESIIDRMDYVWDIAPGRNFIYATANNVQANEWQFEDWTEYYPARSENALTAVYDQVRALCVQEPLNDLIWRPGWLVAAAVGAVLFTLFRRRGRLLIVMLPMVGQVLSLLLSTAWSDYRYFWPLGLCGALAALVLSLAACQESGTAQTISHRPEKRAKRVR